MQPPPAALIITNPIPALVNLDANHTLSVEANGTGLSYQWKRNEIDIAGANNATYTISGFSLQHEGTYKCVVSNSEANASSQRHRPSQPSNVPLNHFLMPMNATAPVGAPKKSLKMPVDLNLRTKLFLKPMDRLQEKTKRSKSIMVPGYQLITIGPRKWM